MPKLTVTAVDGFTAMDEIVGKLGEDAVILSTRKVGSKVEITATNESKTPLPPRRARKRAEPTSFEDVFANADLSLKPQDFERTTADILAEKKAEGLLTPSDIDQILQDRPLSKPVSSSSEAADSTNEAHNVYAAYDVAMDRVEPLNIAATDEKEAEMSRPSKIIDLYPEETPPTSTGHAMGDVAVADELARLQQSVADLSRQISGMVITEASALSETMQRQVSIQLKQAGFSDHVREIYMPTALDENVDGAKHQFAQNMAADMTVPHHQFLSDCDVFLIVGPSGAGKTALSAKIAAYLHDQMPELGITMAKYDADKISFSGDSRNHARLLNLPFLNLTDANVSQVLAKQDGKIIIDCSADTPAGLSLLAQMSGQIDASRIGLIVTLSGASSPRAIRQSLAPYASYGAIVALTHLDECEFGASEFSALAESDAKLGFLTATQSFLDALVLAHAEPVQQYLLNQI